MCFVAHRVNKSRLTFAKAGTWISSRWSFRDMGKDSLPPLAIPHWQRDGAPTHRVLHLHERVLGKNEQHAHHNRTLFHKKNLQVINVLSAPGSGKTALLERTLTDLRGELRAAVIVGDLATDNDAKRLERSGAPIVQITTGTLCHLEAAMIARACEPLDLDTLNLLFIENVGNLVCPASFDLGEGRRVVLTSVTEGEDKPLKYPTLFKTADIVLLTKIELADAAGFDRKAAHKNVRDIAPRAEVFEVSARTGQGLEAWYCLLRGIVHAHA
jgi:hydrogenase nickel incorporation protein HypB